MLKIAPVKATDIRAEVDAVSAPVWPADLQAALQFSHRHGWPPSWMIHHLPGDFQNSSITSGDVHDLHQ